MSTSDVTVSYASQHVGACWSFVSNLTLFRRTLRSRFPGLLQLVSRRSSDTEMANKAIGDAAEAALGVFMAKQGPSWTNIDLVQTYPAVMYLELGRALLANAYTRCSWNDTQSHYIDTCLLCYPASRNRVARALTSQHETRE